MIFRGSCRLCRFNRASSAPTCGKPTHHHRMNHIDWSKFPGDECIVPSDETGDTSLQLDERRQRFLARDIRCIWCRCHLAR
jgi:hypothetical protein